MKSMQFQTIDEKGNKNTYDVIATYYDDEKNKDFMVYTDRTLNKENKLNVYYSLYKKIDNSIKLIDITDKDDEKTALEVVREVISDLKK